MRASTSLLKRFKLKILGWSAHLQTPVTHSQSIRWFLELSGKIIYHILPIWIPLLIRNRHDVITTSSIWLFVYDNKRGGLNVSHGLSVHEKRRRTTPHPNALKALTVFWMSQYHNTSTPPRPTGNMNIYSLLTKLGPIQNINAFIKVLLLKYQDNITTKEKVYNIVYIHK